jgi:vacuolar-type H+-ATPase subunit F/Vma7
MIEDELFQLIGFHVYKQYKTEQQLREVRSELAKEKEVTESRNNEIIHIRERLRHLTEEALKDTV